MPQGRPTHPREQFLEQILQVLWLPVMERHQGIHEAMLRHTQRVLEGECWRVSFMPTAWSCGKSVTCSLWRPAQGWQQDNKSNVHSRPMMVSRSAQAAKHWGLTPGGGHSLLERCHALANSPQAAGPDYLGATMHTEMHQRHRVQNVKVLKSAEAPACTAAAAGLKAALQWFIHASWLPKYQPRSLFMACS